MSFIEDFEVQRPRLLAKLKLEFRTSLAPYVPCLEHILALPVWTEPMARACGLPTDVLISLVADKLCETYLPHRWDPKTGVVSRHDEDREYTLTRAVRDELLEIADETLGGRKSLHAVVALCALKLEATEVVSHATDRNAVGPLWIALAKHASDLTTLAAEVDRRTTEALAKGSSGDALCVIEAGRRLEPVIPELGQALEAAAAKLNAFHESRRPS